MYSPDLTKKLEEISEKFPSDSWGLWAFPHEVLEDELAGTPVEVQIQNVLDIEKAPSKTIH